MAVTIQHVAEKSGVSIKTVSRVLNNEPGVTAATRADVLEAINVLGYVPNLSARRLASHRSFVIGLVLNSCAEYHSQIMMKIIEVGEKLGYCVQLINHDPALQQSRAAINRLVLQKSIDGFLFTPPCDNDIVFLHMCEAANVPFVRLTPRNLTLPFPFVSGCDQEGAYTLTNYLIGLGHKRIGFLYGDPEHQASQLRYNGFMTAMKDHNLEIDPSLIRSGNFQFEDGINETTDMLKTYPRPTAIIASNDESAAGALCAAHQLGVAVPDQLSIAGIDDFPIAKKVWPALTTIHQPMDRISEEAAKLLITLIEKKTSTNTQVYIEEELVIRQSTGPCNE